MAVLVFPAGSVTFHLGDRVVTAQDMSEGNIRTELLDDVCIVNGRNRDQFRLRGEWRYSMEGKTRAAAAGFCDRIGRPRNLAELTKERLRRSARKLKEDAPPFTGDPGFRVLKLDASNIHAWEPDHDDLDGTLLDRIEHVKADRSEEDILYELLLKLGLDLCLPIETRIIAGKSVRWKIPGGRSDANIRFDDLRTLLRSPGLPSGCEALITYSPVGCTRSRLVHTFTAQNTEFPGRNSVWFKFTASEDKPHAPMVVLARHPAKAGIQRSS